MKMTFAYITSSNLTVTVFMIFQAVSPSFWSSMADTRGRRPVYLATLLVYVLACIGLAMVTNYPMLLAFRMLQAFGASSVIAIGAGTIGKKKFCFKVTPETYRRFTNAKCTMCLSHS